MSFEFRAAVRGLLLPVASHLDVEFVAEVQRRLIAMGIEEDQASWINLQQRRWKRDGNPSSQFKKLIRELLFDPLREPSTFLFDSFDGPNGRRYDVAARQMSKQYFSLHGKLVKNYLLPHDEARQILAHSGMIARLAIEESMTSSEISRLIAIRDRRFELKWKVVQAILSQMKLAPKLDMELANTIYDADTEAEPELLGDLDIPGSILRVASVAENLGCIGDFKAWLTDIFIEDLHAPYLMLLHYQMIIQSNYDHAVTYGYEFKPRGQVAQWLTHKYIAAGVPVARNAFLNNAKATLRFDQVWVTGRTDHLRSANALASILEQIECLGALAKEELAAQIRGLLHRNIRVKSEQNAGELPHLLEPLDGGSAGNLLASIGHANTSTTGILEQRLVDCYGSVQHPVNQGWSVRGLSDSVFAANTFRKKLGDVEFERPERNAPESVSYEAHGGKLTLPYVLDHLDSFSFVLGVREEELRSIAPLEDWAFTVVFVAHEFENGLPDQQQIDGCTVGLQYTTFEDVAVVMSGAEHLDMLNRLLVTPLNNGFVHPDVREQALRFMV
jgi:hypothetical protein